MHDNSFILPVAIGNENRFGAVEVANSHLEHDRKIKLPQHTAGNVQEYWVVDLQRRELWVCRHPNNSDYTFQQV
ncbi:MAG: Uma2 family endonuclease [Cyanobacteria bacterium P01_H01_bin.58]